MSSARDLVQELSSLRSVVGPDADEGKLLQLLEKHNGNVHIAITEFFDGPQAFPSTVARPAHQELVQVVTPHGMWPGQQMQVQTPSGTMMVTIPEGVTGGQTFLVRCPPVAQAQVAQGGAGYPGLPHQPVVVVQRRPVVHVVHSRPYYGPYGPYGYGYRPRYGYCDGVGVGVGVLGGLLIADAMFL